MKYHQPRHFSIYSSIYLPYTSSAFSFWRIIWLTLLHILSGCWIPHVWPFGEAAYAICVAREWSSTAHTHTHIHNMHAEEMAQCNSPARADRARSRDTSTEKKNEKMEKKGKKIRSERMSSRKQQPQQQSSRKWKKEKRRRVKKTIKSKNVSIELLDRCVRTYVKRCIIIIIKKSVYFYTEYSYVLYDWSGRLRRMHNMNINNKDGNPQRYCFSHVIRSCNARTAVHTTN